MNLKIGQNSDSIKLDLARKRETEKPGIEFRNVLNEGAKILAAGTRVATGIIGGPFLAAAISPASKAVSLASSNALGVENGDDPLTALGEKGISDDLKLLALQDKIQRDSRQIALVSNVMKARHDTAKSAISNIRS